MGKARNKKEKQKKREIVLCKQYRNILDLPRMFSLRVKKIPATGVFYLDLFEQGRGMIASQVIPDDRISEITLTDMAQIVLEQDFQTPTLSNQHPV